MNVDSAIHTFLTEADDLLQIMEECLLGLEKEPADIDLINEIFRAAHTIKGSAGLFGLNDIVEFTHIVESVLDLVRNNDINIHEKLLALLLESCDYLKYLLKVITDSSLEDNNSINIGEKVRIELEKYLESESSKSFELSTTEIITEQSLTEPTVLDKDSYCANDHWHISIRFGLETYKNGMDPFGFVSYLSNIGSIIHIETILDESVTFDDLDPESCFISFEINFKSDVDIETIREVFDFVKEDSLIRIIPPNSKLKEYIEIIESLPDEEMKLGEILVKCGSLTKDELDEILSNQTNISPKDKRPIGISLIEANLSQPEIVDAALNKQSKVRESKSTESNLIRVDASKLDGLINMVGELIIVSAAATAVALQSNSPKMLEATNSIAELVEDLRDAALGLRMVQIGPSFKRFQRVVRDISKELDKEIKLEIYGEDTELDKSVVEKIADPLTHLVRNAMDHGIESSEDRLKVGKPPYGTVKLKAFHDAGNIMIVVSDDGKGLDREKILAKAIDRGLVEKDQQLSDEEVFNLIFEAGFSTADSISNISGRGVGMDVVKRNIQDLRGTINISSEFNIGTSIEIRLPLTLAIIDGFLVGVGANSYVIPLDMVIECMELDIQQNDVKGSGYLNLRGEVLPYQRLKDYFEVEADSVKRENVVVVKFGATKIGLVVDRLLGELQTVIKPLGKLFNRISGVGGFTILGNGDVALVLDVPGLINQLRDAGIKQHQLTELVEN